jgi:UDP-N-acetylmuramoyl-tripeptide--D-alanyl-D-alanine ligase
MMSLAEAAAAMQGTLKGPDVRFRGVSTDSRAIGRGELFVAIRGEHFDGHAFLAMAKERGASAALVDRGFAGAAPVIAVDDTRKGLGRLGRHWRLRFAPVLIAITGSNGKTTTRNARLDPARARGRGGGARDARKPEYRHRRAAHAAWPAREPPLLRDRARHEPSR